MTGQPKDKLQEVADLEESDEIPEPDDKQETAKVKSRLRYVKYVKFVTTLILEILIQVHAFFYLYHSFILY